MDSVLIASGSEKNIGQLEALFTQNSYRDILSVTSAGEASRNLSNREFDLCLVNAPLRDEFGSTFALNVATSGITQVLMIVKSDILDQVTEQVEDYGILTIPKPINRQSLWSALKLLNATHNKLAHLKKENLDLNQKLQDLRIIDRAKCLLIQYLSMTEIEAHKYIEKQAMDRRMTKKEVAWSVLKTYEN